MSDGFLKLNRKAAEYLIEHEPECFLLITQIALRARRIKKVLDSPDICQALIGDYIKCGLTRQQYRTALKKLETMKIITIKSTNKGSIVTLLDKRIYDINAEDEQPTDSPKSNQQATNKQPLKKNEEVRMEEKDIGEVSLLTLFEKYKSDFTAEELTLKEAFLRHWTAKNEGGKKELWQMQKVFDIKKRFRTWIENEKKWSSGLAPRNAQHDYLVSQAKKVAQDGRPFPEGQDVTKGWDSDDE